MGYLVSAALAFGVLAMGGAFTLSRQVAAQGAKQTAHEKQADKRADVIEHLREAVHDNNVQTNRNAAVLESIREAVGAKKPRLPSE